MNITRNQRRVAAAESRQRSAALTEYDQSQWPKDGDRTRQRVLVSRDFLAQVFVEEGVLRLTVSRTKMRPDGRWEDGITWDELMQVKREAGYGNVFAVEIYPADASVVNVANMRHLWLLPEAPPFAWKKP